MLVVGVDPGGRSSGIVLRDDKQVHAVDVIIRKDEGYRPGPDYLNEVLDMIAAFRRQAGSPLIGIEDMTRPTGFKGGRRDPIDPASLIGTAVVLGAVLAVFPEVIVVPPGGNGSGWLQAYPPELVGGPHNSRWKRAEPKGAGVLRHARSAWDVGGTALTISRQPWRFR